MFDAPLSGIAPLSGDRFGVLSGRDLVILSRKGGAVSQTLLLPEPGTVLAVDPSGTWLAAGTSAGTVAIFEAERSGEFVAGDSSRLHEGEVTAILFERDDLRFFSAGADLKLLSTHARGRLEPEDKGRANAHTDRVSAMIWGPEDRFFTGSRDGTVKSWPRVGGVKPSTQKDGIVKVVALALVKRHDRDHLAVGCEDNSLRVFSLDAAGKFGTLVLRFQGALAGAKEDLRGTDSRAREAAIRTLADFDDAPSLEMLSEQATACASWPRSSLGSPITRALRAFSNRSSIIPTRRCAPRRSKGCAARRGRTNSAFSISRSGVAPSGLDFGRASAGPGADAPGYSRPPLRG